MILGVRLHCISLAPPQGFSIYKGLLFALMRVCCICCLAYDADCVPACPHICPHICPLASVLPPWGGFARHIQFQKAKASQNIAFIYRLLRNGRRDPVVTAPLAVSSRDNSFSHASSLNASLGDPEDLSSLVSLLTATPTPPPAPAPPPGLYSFRVQGLGVRFYLSAFELQKSCLCMGMCPQSAIAALDQGGGASCCLFECRSAELWSQRRCKVLRVCPTRIRR